jgi:hypothetical protein
MRNPPIGKSTHSNASVKNKILSKKELRVLLGIYMPNSSNLFFCSHFGQIMHFMREMMRIMITVNSVLCPVIVSCSRILNYCLHRKEMIALTSNNSDTCFNYRCTLSEFIFSVDNLMLLSQVLV